MADDGNFGGLQSILKMLMMQKLMGAGGAAAGGMPGMLGEQSTDIMPTILADMIKKTQRPKIEQLGGM